MRVGARFYFQQIDIADVEHAKHPKENPCLIAGRSHDNAAFCSDCTLGFPRRPADDKETCEVVYLALDVALQDFQAIEFRSVFARNRSNMLSILLQNRFRGACGVEVGSTLEVRME